MTDTQTLEWDDPITSDGEQPEWTTLPPGTYPFTVTQMMRSRWDGSEKVPPCNMAELSITVDGGQLGEAKLTERLFLLKKWEWKLSQFFRSLGLKKHGEPLVPNWPAVEGARGYCALKVRTYTDKEGQQRTSNSIDRFLDPDKAPAVVSASTAAPPSAPASEAPVTWTPGAF
ncbi:MAG: hypothetical protein LBU07_05030 [Coriobacteriales bacterium]|jgi:hypothetical protein|nr:hypothetical protein [Coriobacteriales bacterium]